MGRIIQCQQESSWPRESPPSLRHGGLWQPLGPHQCPTAGPGPVPGHPRPLRPPGAGPWRVPNGGNSWPGRRQQPRREAWAKCPRFVLTGKLFLRRFHGRDESAAGLSRARCRGRESAAIFPIPRRIPCVFLPPRQPWAAGKEQRAEPGQSSARRSPHPEEFVRRGRAGRNPIPPFPRLGSQRAWASPPWPWPAPRCRTPPSAWVWPPAHPAGPRKKGPAAADSRHLLFVCGSQRSALPRSVKEL